ncbi:MAG: hypothetical protein ACE14M_04410 [Terriglobales bacterium]
MKYGRAIQLVASSKPRVILTAHLSWALVFAVHFGLAYLIRYMRWPIWVEYVVASAITAAAAGVVIGALLWVVYERRCEVHRRLYQIGELNHVVRNALQSMVYSAHLQPDSAHKDFIVDLSQMVSKAVGEITGQAEQEAKLMAMKHSASEVARPAE